MFTKNVDEYSAVIRSTPRSLESDPDAGLAQVQQSERVQKELDVVRQQRRRQHPDGVFLIIEVSRSIREPRSQPALGVVNDMDFDLIVEGPLSPAIIDFRRQAHEAEMSLIGSLRLTVNDHLKHQELQSSDLPSQGQQAPWSIGYH